MNILGDFLNRVNSLYPADIDNEELNGLLTTIRNQGEEIEMKEKEVIRLQGKVDKLESEEDKLRLQVEKEVIGKAAPKSPSHKTPTKRTVKKKKKD